MEPLFSIVHILFPIPVPGPVPCSVSEPLQRGMKHVDGKKVDDCIAAKCHLYLWTVPVLIFFI